MQELKRDSWIFKIAYGNNPKIAPRNVSVCKLFWRITFMLFIGYPAIFLSYIFATVILIVGFGQRFPFFKNDIRNEMGLVDIRFWPKLFGYRVMPIPIMLILLIILSGFKVLSQLVTILWPLIGKDMVLYTSTGLFLSLAFFFFGRWVLSTEYWILFREYVQNIKKNYCSIIPIEEPPQ